MKTIFILIFIVFAIAVVSAILFSRKSKRGTTKEPKLVTYQGVSMVEGWPEQIKEAQTKPTCIIKGKTYKRIRYGEEKDDWGADKQPCHDCAVLKGQLHVQGCDVERCPACDGQFFSCGCNDEEDKE